MGWIANPLFVGSNPILPQDLKVIMNIRKLVQRLEKIESKCKGEAEFVF